VAYETKFEPGQHNVVCATCQAYFKFREIKKQWNNLLTCYSCWDPDPRPILRQPPPSKLEENPAKDIQKEGDD